MDRVTVKTSTIFIAVGDRTRVYRSVDEVPPPLRQRLVESTNSLNSATILIADRRGRQEIMRALRGLPSSIRSRLAASLMPSAKPAGLLVFPHWKRVAQILASGLTIALLWLAYHFR